VLGGGKPGGLHKKPQPGKKKKKTGQGGGHFSSLGWGNNRRNEGTRQEKGKPGTSGRGRGGHSRDKKAASCQQRFLLGREGNKKGRPTQMPTKRKESNVVPRKRWVGER